MTTTEEPKVISGEVAVITPYEKTREQVTAFVDGYTNLVVTDETFEESKKARMALRDLRYSIKATETANTNKLNELKDKNWSQAKELIALITPTEDTIDAGIKSIENRKAAAKAEKERIEREKVEAEIRAEQERLAKLEAERIAAIEAEQEKERQRLAALQAEIEAKQKAERDALDKIRIKQEAKEAEMQAQQKQIAEEQRAREAEIKRQQEAIDAEYRAIAENKAREEAERIRAIELEQARLMAIEKERAEAEYRIKREAEEKIEAEKRVQEELARQEALKPDKVKLQDFCIALCAFPMPELADSKAQAIVGKVRLKVNEIQTLIETELQKL